VAAYANYYVGPPPGGSWQGAVQLDANTGFDVAAMSLAVSAGGDAMVVLKQDNGGNRVYANRFNGAAWGGAGLIEDNGGTTVIEPDVDIDDSGNAIASWRQWDGLAFRLYTNRYTADSGRAICVWRQVDDLFDNRLWANVYTSGP